MNARRRLRNTLSTALVLAFVGTALAAPGQAGLISTGPAAFCGPSSSQVFAPWGDYANYVLMPGGSFEPGTPSWALTGGARIVAGNEPFAVSGPGSSSLLLPSGSSATTGTVCFAFGDWDLRLFARNVGSPIGALHVTVIVPSLLGVTSVLDGGTFRTDGSWQPSPQLELALTNVTSLLGTQAVAFKFSSIGLGAAYQIDDVYLDPWKSS